jgi:hypothetical protein
MDIVEAGVVLQVARGKRGDLASVSTSKMISLRQGRKKKPPPRQPKKVSSQ